MGVDLYWIGTANNDTWTDPTKWSLNPNGSSANVVPTKDDNVFFLSYTPSTAVVTLPTSVVIPVNNFTIKNFAGSFQIFNGLVYIHSYGNLNYWSNMNLLSDSGASVIRFYFIGQTISISCLNPTDGLYYTIQNASLRIGQGSDANPIPYVPTVVFSSKLYMGLSSTMYINQGNVSFTDGADLSNYAILNVQGSDAGVTPVMNLGASTYTLSGGATFGIFTTPYDKGGIINGDTSTIEIVGNDNQGAQIRGNLQSYFYNIKVTSSGGTSTVPSGPSFVNVNIKNLFISTRTAKSLVVRCTLGYWVMFNRLAIPTTNTTPLILGSSAAIPNGTIVFTRKIGVGNCTYTANASACIEKWDGTEGDENYISYLTVNRIQVSYTVTDFNFFQNP